MVRRDTGQKTPVNEADIPATVEKLLQEIQDNLFAKAKAILQEKTNPCKVTTNSRRCYEKKAVSLRQHGAAAPDCEAKVKDETGATIRIRPFQK